MAPLPNAVKGGRPMPTTRQALLALLCEQPGQDISGQALADRLGVSRAAVHKAAAALQKQGYAIQAVSGRGYRLTAESDCLTREELEQLYGNTCRCTQPGCPGGPDCPAFPAAGRNTGSGSPSRGPGDAPLIYTPSDTQVTEGGIREKLRSESLRRIPGEQLGLSFSAPEVFRPEDNSYGSAGGSLLREPGSAVPGGENRGMRLSPRDRRTVGKFFRDAVE